jgi:hypothetical protein
MVGLWRWAGLGAWLAVAMAAQLAGCCGGGSSHRCDFSPATAGKDAGTDSGLNCLNLSCTAPQVCCITKIAPFTSCVDPADFVADVCETFKLDAPLCGSPQDCPGGFCCYQTNLNLVSCQTAAACPGNGFDTYRICLTDQDCATTGSKSCVGQMGDPLDGGTVGVCAP